MWNASFVQKRSNYTWQEWVGEETREIWKGTIAMSSARWNKLTDCENRANREIWKQVIWKRHGGSWVGHIPCPKMKQVRDKGVPSSYHHGKAVSSLVDDCQAMHPPPAVWLEVLHLFKCFTHTPSRGRVGKLRSGQWDDIENERKWRWGENEIKMKVTQPGLEEGNAKEEGRSKHQHKWTWPKAGKPWKGRGKEKRRPTDTEQDQRWGGRTEAPKPTYHSGTYAYLSTRRTQPTCREGEHMK